jgi:outer membrane protein OmpA-like peptidoglycan-associated protein
MSTRRFIFVSATLTSLLLALHIHPSAAQDGKLKVRATPREAYVFVDGLARSEARRTIRVAPGSHKINLYNYGFKPAQRDVSIAAGQTTTLEVPLETTPLTTTGPWGCITVEGASRAAILLNGETPDYFVGHGDEFNHEWLWKQELIVPPGTHRITVVQEGKQVWSGSVNVPANQRVVIDANKGRVRKTVAWPRGQQLGSQAPFRAGTASATVAVAPVAIQQFAAKPAQIDCGESSHLNWSTSGAVRNEISGQGEVAASGDQAVQPKQTTTYNLTASGPGGTATSSATVNVNSGVQASLSVSPAEIRYRRKGDNVLEQGTATLAWSASGADSASLDPFGSVSATGSRTLQATPRKTDPGPVDETVTYTLRAGNACGGTEMRTATLRITGVIEPAVSPVETTLEARLSANSIYFPTALPSKRDPNGGLVPSQQQSLDKLANDFKQYLQFRPDARLILQAHADRRGSKESNKALSERRSNRAKQYLIDQGVPVANLETVAYGSEQNLTEPEVKQLIEGNPDLSEQDRKTLMQNWRSVLLLQNRRVDIMLSTTKQQSKRYFPLNAADFKELMK